MVQIIGHSKDNQLCSLLITISLLPNLLMSVHHQLNPFSLSVCAYAYVQFDRRHTHQNIKGNEHTLGEREKLAEDPLQLLSQVVINPSACSLPHTIPSTVPSFPSRFAIDNNNNNNNIILVI